MFCRHRYSSSGTRTSCCHCPSIQRYRTHFPISYRDFGLQPSPVIIRHSAKAMRACGVRMIEGTRMHGNPPSQGLNTSTLITRASQPCGGNTIKQLRRKHPQRVRKTEKRVKSKTSGTTFWVRKSGWANEGGFKENTDRLSKDLFRLLKPRNANRIQRIREYRTRSKRWHSNGHEVQ